MTKRKSSRKFHWTPGRTPDTRLRKTRGRAVNNVLTKLETPIAKKSKTEKVKKLETGRVTKREPRKVTRHTLKQLSTPIKKSKPKKEKEPQYHQRSCGTCGLSIKVSSCCNIKCTNCKAYYHDTCCAVLKEEIELVRPTFLCYFCQPCRICDLNSETDTLYFCDSCNGGFHSTCLDPPMKRLDDTCSEPWHCADCSSACCQLCQHPVHSSAGDELCIECSSRRQCSACDTEYAHGSILISCDFCCRYFHAECQGLRTVDAIKTAMAAEFICSECLSADNPIRNRYSLVQYGNSHVYHFFVRLLNRYDKELLKGKKDPKRFSPRYSTPNYKRCAPDKTPETRLMNTLARKIKNATSFFGPVLNRDVEGPPVLQEFLVDPADDLHNECTYLDERGTVELEAMLKKDLELVAMIGTGEEGCTVSKKDEAWEIPYMIRHPTIYLPRGLSHARPRDTSLGNYEWFVDTATHPSVEFIEQIMEKRMKTR